MSDVKTVKVDDETWSIFKSLAAQNNMRLGNYLRTLLKNEEKAVSGAWARILKRKPGFSAEDAESMHRTLRELRSDKGYRD